MKIALVNPPWRFEGSIYFGCKAEHLPIELGAARALLLREGHEVLMLDGALDDLDAEGAADRVAAFAPDLTVLTTAPTYLFWRCAPPELRSPRAFLDTLGGRGGRTVAVGPHVSVTPQTTLRKLGCDLGIRGECEEALVELAGGQEVGTISGMAWREGEDVRVLGGPRATTFTDLPVLEWPDHWIQRHGHHHHRYGTEPVGLGAEVEASRGCPYSCSFCAKIDFRDKYRRRDLPVLLEEIDRLIGQGVRYLYFIDEIFLPWRQLLEALVERGIEFGVQTRIDLWKPQMIELLGRAGCVSIEAGVESITEEGRAALDKDCRVTTDTLTERLLLAREHVPFVQANLIEVSADEQADLERWRDEVRSHGVWANDPVPLYPYPSSPDYRKLWGAPDEKAWERAHAHYLSEFDRFSDIQDARPLPLETIEASFAQ
ncbi:TIGR04295 family B12-binding domain-containing radical SAM protein [Parvularcula oceani]|uniref:TIGR04295 family B12-binding domain-containing radical SAM protein n=1 Tax=Parvularcula oceani TaxID=1247963 RepID=UPI0004E13509|nr:TIGR04295 family B12-binding domain-containing radical SAM protein [Parvularcula oceani]